MSKTHSGFELKIGEVNGLIVIIIDPTVEIGESSTGKMMGVASTGGFTKLSGALSGNIYIGKKNK
jgi:hypothetical protein